MTLKKDLQPHYKVISKLLAKTGQLDNEGLLHEPRADCQIFYIFCTLMRMRSLRYFTWWTAINTAAYQGKSLSNITSFFGITMHQYSLTRKLKGVTSQAKVMEHCCRATLIVSGKEGVSAVDNSQFQTPRKHQWQGVSSKMNMYSF